MKFILGFPKLISRDINDLFSLTEDAKFTPSSLVKLQYVKFNVNIVLFFDNDFFIDQYSLRIVPIKSSLLLFSISCYIFTKPFF